MRTSASRGSAGAPGEPGAPRRARHGGRTGARRRARGAWGAVLLIAALALLVAACGGGDGFTSVDAIEEDLRAQVSADLPDGRSPGEATCIDDEATADLRTYDCQVQVFAIRPRDDQIVRFRVEATSDGRWTARRTGVVTFD